MANSVVIRIDGDDSGFRKELKSTEVSARAAAASIAAEYKKAGMSTSEAMKEAWSEVKSAQEAGGSVVIKGIDTIIQKNEDLAQSVRKSTANAYKPLASSADAAADSVIDDLERIEQKTSDTLAGIRKAGQSAGNALKGIASATGTAFKGVTAATGLLSAAWGAVGAATVQYNANIETLTTSFQTMTGSAEKASQIVSRLRQLGASTPFEMTDLAETTQLLMQYGLSADDAIEKMTMLGDIAQGNAENMQRVATAYGQMSSAGKVSLEDVKQMIEAGFNPLQEISAHTGESMASLYDRISVGTLSVEEITAAMQRATSEGGKFYRSMELQSQTLNGQLSTLKDNAQELAGAIFTPFTEALRTDILPEAIEILGGLSEAYEAGGVDGLIAALERKTPELAETGVKSAEALLAGVTKKMPVFVKSAVSTIPTILKSSATLVPLLTDSFFTILSDVVEQTMTMLPELVPTLIGGLGDVAVSVGKGVAKIFVGASDGLVAALKGMGIIGKTAEDVFDELLASVDMTGMGDISQTVKANLNVDLTVEDYQTEINDAITAIKTALEGTPGLTDSEKAKIEAAILSGSGLDIFQAILETTELSETEKAKITSDVSSSVETIKSAFSVLDGLETEARTRITQLTAEGASAEELKAALIGYGIDPAEAETAAGKLSSAGNSIKSALDGLNALPGTVSAVVNNLLSIGADETTIADALISLGIDPTVAATTAATITSANDTIEEAAKKIGIDPLVLSDILLRTQGDHDSLKSALTFLGVSQEDIQTILDSYDTAKNSLTAKAKGVYTGIIAEFTDGVPETNEDVQKAKAAVQGLFAEAYTRIETWRDEKLSELEESGLTGSTLTSAVDDVKAEYTSLTTTLKALEDESLAWTQENAEKSTEVVESNLNRLQVIMDQVEAITAQIDVLTNEAFNTARARRTLVQKGAVTNQEHQLEAFALTSAELDERLQDAELRAAEAFDKAAEEFGDDTEAYKAREKEILDQLAADKAAAYAKYNEENEKIMAGIAKATIGPEYEEEKRLTELAERLQTAIADAQTAYMLEGTRTTGSALLKNLEISQEDIQKLADRMGVDSGTFSDEISKSITSGLDAGLYQSIMQYAGSFDGAIAKALEDGSLNMDSVAAVLNQAIQDGYLRESADGVDWTDAGTLLQSMLESVGEQSAAGLANGLTSNTSISNAEDAGADLAQSAIDGANSAAEVASPSKVFIRMGRYMGDGLALGLRSTQSKVRAAAVALANTVADAIRGELDIHSPSRVTLEMGTFTGEGFGIGLEKSLRDVLKRTRHIAGTLNLTPRMTFPDIAGAFSEATQAMVGDSNTEIALYVNGRDMGRVMAADNQRAGNARTRAIQLGYGRL